MITIRMTSSHRRRKAGTHLGEVVGEAAAVCCCCPCGLANFMYLAIYKLPASLCRRVLCSHRQRRRKRLASKQGKCPAKLRGRGCSYGCGDDFGAKIHPEGDVEDVMKEINFEDLEEEQDKDLVELEKEMWEKFYSTGFWRSCSRRREDSSSPSQRIFSIVSGSFDASIL